MKITKEVFVSDRGFLLMDQEPISVPLVTVENYMKWYNLFILHPDGKVEKVNPGLIDDALHAGHHMVDHTWHPKLVQHVARAIGAEVSIPTIEVIAGRWVIERELLEDIDYGIYDQDEESGID